MEDGRIIAEGTAPEVGKALRESRSGMFIAMPAPMRVWAGVPSGLDCPATVREGRKWLETYTETHALSPIPESRSASLPASAPAIELREVWFRYERGLPDVVKGLSLTVMRGEVFAVVGGNGAGKTTALSLISGMLKPYRGSVKAGGWDVLKIPDAERFGGLFGVLPQNPKALFAEKTLEEDLRGVLRGRGRSADEERRRFRRVIGLCELAPLLQSHPYDLSGGEQQRAALAEILLLNPEILLLDEPTKGLDAHFKQKLGRLLRELREDGVTVFIVSHDIEFCAAFADRCAMFFDGAVVSTGAPRDFFSGKSFYTTAANRMARALLPSAILAEDIIKACSGVEASPPEQQGPPRQNPARSGRAGPPDAGSGRPPEGADGGECMNPAPAGITAIALIAFLLAVPLTVILGAALFGARRYYFTSLLVVLEAMVPFALIFEKRRPAARELVLIAALSAIAVMGRAAFFMLPQFKPALAIIIVTGIAFGGETGFLVGALSAFVSNFFLGQGPWTPWQMFAFGITGFLAGAVFKKGRPNRAALCAFGAVSALLCGAVLNAASVLMVQPHPTPPMLAAAYALGLPFDLVHGAATALFLFFIARPMMEKLERVIIKYKLFGFRRRNPRQHMGGMV